MSLLGETAAPASRLSLASQPSLFTNQKGNTCVDTTSLRHVASAPTPSSHSAKS